MPLAEKAGQGLYARMLTNANWGGVWQDVPVNRKTIRPLSVIPVRLAAKLLHAPFGRERWHRFERRYFQYWLDATCNAACVPYEPRQERYPRRSPPYRLACRALSRRGTAWRSISFRRGTDFVRVLFLARLFAGLKSGLAKGRWEPGGVPAIYRLIEGLAADRDVELLTVFSVKEPDPRFPNRCGETLPVIGDTVILPFAMPFGAGARRSNAAWNEASHTARLLGLAARFKPDVVYANYTNVLPAALLARAGYPVVLRLMGVQSHHRDIAAGKAPFFRWQMQSPFAHVVCTEDGSDPAALIPKLVRADTPWTVRLNGCDAKALPESEVQAFRAETGLGGRPVVLFLGRLEPTKALLNSSRRRSRCCGRSRMVRMSWWLETDRYEARWRHASTRLAWPGMFNSLARNPTPV